MVTSNWQMQIPTDAIVFDCDGTLTAVEGIDELAKSNGVLATVKTLTETAMAKTGLNPDIYQQRLQLVKPSMQQVINLGNDYFNRRIPDARFLIQLLKRLNKDIFLISAGLNPAVSLFGEKMEIKRENIYAVNANFDAEGHYIDFDHGSPLIYNHGKREIIEKLKSQYKNIILVGDGLNDYSAQDLVSRFIGYGGVFYRTEIANLCHYYIYTLSLASILPLILTKVELKALVPAEKNLYQKGLNAIEYGLVKMQC
jgi:phosphoserine phosphatase